MELEETPTKTLQTPALFLDNTKDNIQVLVRVRPLSSKEISEGARSCLIIDDQNPQKLVLDCKSENKTFCFDYVAGENISQKQLFHIVGKPLSQICLDGYNICVFAYGQTGAGKTFTMQGKCEVEEEMGLQPNVFNYLFELMKRNQEQWSYTVKCSYLEIYNEQINDLLRNNNSGLQVREDVKKGPYVEDLSEEKVENAQQLLDLLKKGMRNRHIGSTYMNFESSRSHSIFTLFVEGKKKSNNIINERLSKLNFVDLAGSERQKQSGTAGTRLKEAGNINKSLTILGCVINSLVESTHRKSRHIPYRDSKLTFILRDSLGGNSKTCMIAAVSNASSSFCETLSTLKFAQRAKLIKNQALVNEEATGNVEMLKSEIKRLKEELNKFIGLKNHNSNLEISLCETNDSKQNDKNKEKEMFFWILLKKSLGLQEGLREEILKHEENIEKLKSFLDVCSSNESIYKYLFRLYGKVINEKLLERNNDQINNNNDQDFLLKERKLLHEILFNYNWVYEKACKEFSQADCFSLNLSEKYLENKFLCEQILDMLKEELEKNTKISGFPIINPSEVKNLFFEEISLEEINTYLHSFLKNDDTLLSDSTKNNSVLEKEKDSKEDLEHDLHRLQEENETLQVSLLYEREESKRKTDLIHVLEQKAVQTSDFENQSAIEKKNLLEENSKLLSKISSLKGNLEEQEFEVIYLKGVEIENKRNLEELKREKAILQQKIQEFENEKESLEVEIFEIKEENVSLNDKLEAIVIENDIIKEEKMEIVEKCEKLIKEIHTKEEYYSSKIKEANAVIENLNNEKKLMQEKNDCLQTELHGFKQKFNDLKRENEKILLDNGNLQKELSNLLQINAEIKAQNEAEINKLNTLLLRIKEKIKERDRKIELLIKENEAKEQELFRTAINIKETLQQSKAAFEELKTLETLKKENEKLGVSLKAANEENERLNDLYNKLEYQSNIMKANYKIKEEQMLKIIEEKKLAELMNSKYVKQIQNLTDKLQFSNQNKMIFQEFTSFNHEIYEKTTMINTGHFKDIKNENMTLKNEIIALKEINENYKKIIDELSKKNHQDPKKVLNFLDEILKLKNEIKGLKQEKKTIFENMERLNQMFSPMNNFSFQTMTEEFDIDNFYNKLEAMIQNLKERENRIFERENEMELNESKLVLVKQEYNIMVKNIELKRTEFSPHRLEKFNLNFIKEEELKSRFEVLAKSENLLKKKPLQIEDYLTLPKKKIKLQ